MPGFDGSGPAGRGSMTGWGRGYCGGDVSYGPRRSWSRRGVGACYGRGRGYRHMFRGTGMPPWARRQSDWQGPGRMPYYSQKDEVRMLKAEAEALKDDLTAIERRLGELESGKQPDE